MFHNEYVECPNIDIPICSIRGVMNLFSRTNIGLSKATNIAINRVTKTVTKDYICLIDDDMTVTKNWDKHLLDAHIKTKSDWVASTMIEPIPPRWNIGTESYKRGFKPLHWYRNISNTPLLIPTKFWKLIGGYDEDFPNVGAELGLAKRAYDHDVRNFVQTPLSLVYHKQSQSMKKLENRGKLAKKRDTIFKAKYNISRKEFTKLIGKGEIYDSTF